VKADIMEADGGDDIAAVTRFPQTGFLADHKHGAYDAVGGEQVGNIEGNVIRVGVHQILDIKADIEIHSEFLWLAFEGGKDDVADEVLLIRL
jgi:hypothetical protein